MADVKELNINNTTYDIKAKTVVNQNGGSLKYWTGTKAQYDAIVTKDNTTMYYLTDIHAIYLGDTLVVNLANRNIGEIIPSILPLTDAGLHLLDGTLILGNGIYSSFVDYIAGLVTNYPNLFVTEVDWQTSVNTYGVCGKFVYTNEISATMPSLGTLTGTRNPSSDMDAGSLGMRYAWNVPELGGDIFTVSKTPNVGDAIWVYQNGSWVNSGVNIEAVNHSVRLPKITGIIEGTTDLSALGDLVEAGLPNITGEVAFKGQAGGNQYQASGAFSYIEYGKAGSDQGNNAYWRADFNASRSSSIYGNSSTVQPQTIKCHYYIVIATSTKTDIQVDIDEIATDLNSKADVDLSNVPSSKGILTESYINGTSWYRIYSDGWCEQGGTIDNVGTSSTPIAGNTIILLKAYTNANYTVIIGGKDNRYASTVEPGVKVVDGTSFAILTGGDAVRFYWRACGYIR